MPNEIEWVDVSKFPDLYKININGEVMSKRTGKIINQHINRFGYYCVNTHTHWKRGRNILKVHRLLAIAFLPNPESLPAINHKNGIKTDNRLENLEWCTNKHNVNEAFRLGLHESTQKAVISRNSKIVIDTNTGVYYNSAKELSNLLGIVHGTLISWLSGQNTNKTSYRYA